MSKGDHRRPRMVDREKFEKAWDAIFGAGSARDYQELQEAPFEYRPATNASREGSEAEPAVRGEN